MLGRGALAVALALAACGERADPDTQAPPAAAEAPGAAPAASGPAAAPEARTVADPVLTPEGYGPVRIGMTAAEARQALGPDVIDNPAATPDPQACHFLRTRQEPPTVLYMVQQGRVTRVSFVRSGPARTDKGLGVGSTAAQVRAAYGEAVKAQPHKYVEAPAEDLFVWTQPGQRGIRYEIDAKGLVSAVHAGDQSIELVEGCS